MCGKRSCGRMAGGVPSSIPLQDTRTGHKRPVQTPTPVGGERITLNDQRGMNQRKLDVRNPLSGKR